MPTGRKPPYRPPCNVEVIAGPPARWDGIKQSLLGCDSERTDYEDGKFEPHPEGWPRSENTTVVPCIQCDGTLSETKTTSPYAVAPCALDDDPEACLDDMECAEGDPVDCASCVEDDCDNAKENIRFTAG